jgi:hypothetical protein
MRVPFFFLFPAELDSGIAGPEEAKNLAGKYPPPDSDPFNDCLVWQESRLLVKTIRRKRRLQIRVPETPSFIGTHNEMLSVAAMCVGNKDRSPGGINRCNTAPTPTGFAEIYPR